MPASTATLAIVPMVRPAAIRDYDTEKSRFR